MLHENNIIIHHYFFVCVWVCEQVALLISGMNSFGEYQCDPSAGNQKVKEKRFYETTLFCFVLKLLKYSTNCFLKQVSVARDSLRRFSSSNKKEKAKFFSSTNFIGKTRLYFIE